jgi:hypothetical protein
MTLARPKLAAHEAEDGRASYPLPWANAATLASTMTPKGAPVPLQPSDLADAGVGEDPTLGRRSAPGDVAHDGLHGRR